MLGFTRCENKVYDVAKYLIVYIDLAHYFARMEYIVGRHYGADLGERALHIEENNALLLFSAGVVYVYLEHETIHLSLGEGISTLLLQRILGSHYKEWLRKRIGSISDGYLTLLHRLE